MKYVITLLIPFAFCIQSSAQTYVDRAYYGQKMEPLNGIIHGAGQDPGEEGGYNQPFFDGYIAEMDSGEYPMSYMVYESIDGLGKDWAIDLRKKLLPYQDQQIVLQFGVYLVNQLDRIANGSLDDDLEVWMSGLEELGLPVYVRIGYEFNGPWNNYDPTSYKAAFKYITNKLRERESIESATVWNLAVEGNTNYMLWYPGDEFVDWWSINYFSAEDVELAVSDNFLDDAHNHSRPVLIGESTPRYVGVTDGQSDWDTWFTPFFDLIATEPGIKMTGYINWQWSDQTIEPVWNNWGDARLSSNEVVAQNFRNEMDDSLYIHLADDKIFRETLGVTESVAPSVASNLRLDNVEYPQRLGWDNATDDSGIARYLIYVNNELFSFTGKNGYTFYDLKKDEGIDVAIQTIDRAGNRSALSESFEITGVGEEEEPIDTTKFEPGDNIIINSDFDEGALSWTLQNFSGGSASATFSVDTTGKLSGENAALVDITQNSGTNFHILLEQQVDLIAEAKYKVTYQARANSATNLETWIQEAGGNFFYLNETISLTEEPQSYSHTFDVEDNTSNVFLKFMMGVSGVNKIWIDSVEVAQLLPTHNESEFDEKPNSIKLYQNYPNPFNPSTEISFNLSEPGFTTLKVYNTLGMEVATLISDRKNAGLHSVSFDGGKLSSGVYFYRLTSGANILTQKMLLLK